MRQLTDDFILIDVSCEVDRPKCENICLLLFLFSEKKLLQCEILIDDILILQVLIRSDELQ